MSGYVKIFRKIKEWEFYSYPPARDLFFHLLLTVNYKPSRYRGYDIPEGACVIGIKKISEELGFSIQQVRTAVHKLKSAHQITIRTTNNFSIVTITNWSKYQGSNTPDNNQITNEQQTNNKPITTSKEGKNIINTVVDAREDLESEKKPDRDHVVVGKQIAAITGWDRDPNWFGDYARIETWLRHGWEPELDIYPTVRRLITKKTGPPPRNLKYFEQAIADTHSARKQPLPSGVKYEPNTEKSAVSGADRALARVLGKIGTDRAKGQKPLRGAEQIRDDGDGVGEPDGSNDRGFATLSTGTH